MCRIQTVCYSNQVIIFGNVVYEYQTKAFTYNDETREWKLNDCKYMKIKLGFSCMKYHQ